MAFKTAAELVVFSTGTFVDNSTGDISPLDFRNMHQHLADSMIPYDASGVYGVKVLPTGNVPTTTPTGYLVYDNGLKIYTGTAWSGVGDTSTTYTAGTGLQLAGTVFNTLTASTSVTGVTILTNTIDASQNKALTPKAVNDAGYITAHPTISNAASNSDNSGRTYIQDLLFDSNGHVTGVTTATETVTDTDTTYTAGTGLALNGTQFSTQGTGTFLALDLATTGTTVYKEGRMFYDTDDKALGFYNDESGITLQIGQENWVRVRNNSGSTIANGKVVRITGSQGTNPTIVLARANSFENASSVGLATHDIENNSFGYVTTFGLVRGIATSGLTEGNSIYISPSTSGELIDFRPAPPNYSSNIGRVVRSHASNGIIFLHEPSVRIGGGQVSNTGIQLSGIPFFSYTIGSDSSLSSNNGFAYDSGNSRLLAPSIVVSNTGNFSRSVTVGSGVELLAGTPTPTTNRLYNVGGSLYFDGSPVAGGGGGADWTVADGVGNSEVISSGETVYFSGISPTTVTFDGATNVVSISGGGGTVYTAGTGLALNGSEFSTAGTGNFDAVVVSDSGNIGGVFTTNKAVKTAIKSNPDGATITFDLNESNTHYATLGGNRTLALSNVDVGQKFLLRLQQDATGSRTVTWFSTIKWDGVTPPTLSTSGNRADLFGFLCTSGNQYDGMVLAQNL